MALVLVPQPILSKRRRHFFKLGGAGSITSAEAHQVKSVSRFNSMPYGPHRQQHRLARKGYTKALAEPRFALTGKALAMGESVAVCRLVSRQRLGRFGAPLFGLITGEEKVLKTDPSGLRIACRVGR